MSLLSAELADNKGIISPKSIADRFHVTLHEVAGMAGVSLAVLQRTQRAHSAKTQSTLRQMLEILNMVTPWAGSPLAAYAWYRSEPIPAFGGITAESAVKMGKAQAVKEYIDSIALGGYA